MLFLVVMGVFFIGNLAFLVYMLFRKRTVNLPLTARARLQEAPAFEVSVVRKPRLTANGRVILFMAVSFGVVAFGVSLALVSRVATTGLTAAAVPAVVMSLLIDLVPIGFATALHWTYKLVLTGRFATGIAVSASVEGIRSWGVFYDFLDDRGEVVRGSSLRSFYTIALARAFRGALAGDYFAVGSYVPVLYRAGDPNRNALYVSFPWSI